MTLYYSTDLGESWTAYCNVDLAGNDPDDNGVWEPYFIFEEETGRVYCFYSDESNEANDKHGPAAQKLVYKYTTDMKTWDLEGGPGTFLLFNEFGQCVLLMCSVSLSLM